MNRGKGIKGQRAHVVIVDEAAQVPTFDFEAASVAMQRQLTSATWVRDFAGPVPDPVKPTKPSATGFSAGVRRAILERDNYACARCGIPIDTGICGYSLQHRDNRGMGGTSDPATNKAGNGLTMCGSGVTGCHGWAEANPTEAERLGYAVASWADPTSVPVLIKDRGWVLLDHDGRRTPTTPPPMNDAHAVATRKDK